MVCVVGYFFGLAVGTGYCVSWRMWTAACGVNVTLRWILGEPGSLSDDDRSTAHALAGPPPFGLFRVELGAEAVV